MSCPRRLDRIDIADHVGDRDVRGSQLFDIALVAVQPRDVRVVGLIGDEVAAAAADRHVRVVVDFAAGEVRRPFVQQSCELADEARFGLAAEAKQNEIVPGKKGVDYLRHHRIFVAYDAGKQRFASLDGTDQVFSDFVFYAALRKFCFREGTGAQGRQGAG
jgi:hypothetical protein